jgi:dTDP-4-dehydrorhamnose reductase
MNQAVECLNAQLRVLVTGKNGQLGWELARTLPDAIRIMSIRGISIEAIFLDSKALDITCSESVFEQVKSFKPDIVINAAAYTAVDKAETDSEAAYLVNQKGAGNLALACKQFGAKLIHISTDFVFDATKNTPYQPTDKTNPLGVYGASKLAGEQVVVEILAEDVSIIRTAWLYSTHGNNFVKTMLRLMAEKDQLSVVADQIGTPTSAKNLAKAIWLFVERMTALKTKSPGTNSITKVYHWTDLGTASWYDFAVAIQEIAYEQGILSKKIMINPIETSEYPTPAKRPAYSVLNTSLLRKDIALPGEHWRKGLSDMMCELKVVSA